MRKEFKKRTYKNIGQFFSDIKFMSSHRIEVHEAMNNGLLDDAFRERLMMAVTSVNGCRYCSYVHSREALKAGVTAEEIAAMTECEFGTCPTEEQPGLLYAQHWAETNAQPDPEARNRVLDIYGEEKLKTIELALRMIRMGNLLGNSFDKLLFALSFGLLGV
ncbi:MAG: carboxymuconolactone decarboxylase family protein [Anaerolineae bacterium]|jgi:AhpD family alkylhydroperoxidase|nr:carboxymuconolactone decarboxylase family protein [Anaerolineae bacterium]